MNNPKTKMFVGRAEFARKATKVIKNPATKRRRQRGQNERAAIEDELTVEGMELETELDYEES